MLNGEENMIIKKIGKLMSTIMQQKKQKQYASTIRETTISTQKHRLVQSQEQEIFFAGYVTSY